MEISVQESELNKQMEGQSSEAITLIKPEPSDILRAHTAKELANGANPMELVVDSSVQETAKNLATIQRIASLTPIEGADKIELAKMEGLEWQSCCSKIHKVGDLVCYIQIDTICPETAPWAQFLKDRHYRVRTIRLKKQLSQGLIIPLKDFEVIPGVIEQGQDMTGAFGIIKYEQPIPIQLQGRIKGDFPTKYVAVTDEERLQNCSRILEELQGVPMFISVKMDGSFRHLHLFPKCAFGRRRRTCLFLVKKLKGNL